jgi:hypothetical protein
LLLNLALDVDNLYLELLIYNFHRLSLHHRPISILLFIVRTQLVLLYELEQFDIVALELQFRIL